MIGSQHLNERPRQDEAPRERQSGFRSILVIDGSHAVQDLARNALGEAGYRVTTASNGAAVLTYPSLDDIDLLVIDSELAGLTGRETCRLLKQNDGTHEMPVLLLVPEGAVPNRENLELGPVNHFLLKPFDPRQLVRKVEQIFQQKALDQLTLEHMQRSADRIMTQLAEKQIQAAVERKTQLIIERCIQNITLSVDQYARNEVDSRITALVSDKEQELVKLTVREVANSMVEKLAVAKVEEALQGVLAQQTEAAVRRVTDQTLPGVIRERVREMLGNLLPREIETRLERAAEKMAPELSQQLIGTVEAVVNKTVPRSAREMLPPVVEGQVRAAMETSIPKRVSDLVAVELRTQMTQRIDPAIDAATRRISRGVLMINAAVGFLVLCGLGAMAWLTFFAK
ncbi:MAG TPA: response regulator [Candidatus Sumerlaeota bacterium]|nr:MAG: Alkaline phosphatase synthesis transcriptional regulatory protein PhoP [candidate division BRC1 bacterium ADurb.BinA292]HOE95789.1 response regulator [Candidatus Sumerlaeota bacterium]HOR29642.1 response regulator [Candidatus Sumerlaeota bacterium]HPK02246.1 response regulator [Candidatus Sumerlaeota bacterium]